MRMAYRLLLIFLLGATLAVVSAGAAHTGCHLLSARGHLLAIEGIAQSSQWGPADLGAVEEHLHEAYVDLAAVEAQVRPLFPLCPHLGWVPHVGGDIGAAPHLLQMGLGALRAGELSVEALAPLMLIPEEAPSDEVPPPSLEEILGRGVDALLADRSELLAARVELDRASRARQAIDGQTLSPYTAALMARADAYLTLARFGVQGALLAPELLGASAPKNYLILLQNEDELRATGGFISGVGLVCLHRGKILELSFQDSYTILTRADPDPPSTLERYMLAQVWLLRDVNWSPDFPTAARLATDIYERDRGIDVDGVIAVDQEAVRALLEALGPVQVNGWERPVTGRNVTAVIRQAWAPDAKADMGQWWAHRKDFMGTIAEAIVRRLEGGTDGVDPLRLVSTLQQALLEKHILIHLEDPLAAEIVAENEWDGAILPAKGDYLMVIDTNVGFNKVNANVEQDLDYHVRIQPDGSLRSNLTLTYHNHSSREVAQCIQEARYDPTYEGMMDRCHWDFLRVYVPGGARLLDGTRNPLPVGSLYRQMTGEGEGTGEPTLQPGEGGKDTLQTFFVVPPRQSREIRFTYKQPQCIQVQGRDKQYSLLLQKQAGTLALPIRVRVEMPPSTQIRATGPIPSVVRGHTVEYNLRLSTTQRLEITFR